MEITTIQGGSLHTNCYLVSGETDGSCVLIDPGFQAEQILEQVRSKGKTVAAILLTHAHFDHISGARDIAEQTGCKVYLHEADRSLPSQLTLSTLPPTENYGEGDVLSLAGLTFRVLHTPGHTPGGVCLLCGDAMFSGDTLFAGTCGRTDLPGGNYKDMLQSLSRLAALEGDWRVLPGHGGDSTLSYERRSNPYLQGS